MEKTIDYQQVTKYNIISIVRYRTRLFGGEQSEVKNNK
jgi:hypothetical protein